MVTAVCRCSWPIRNAVSVSRSWTMCCPPIKEKKCPAKSCRALISYHIDPEVCDGCHINRKIDRLVEEAGFELTDLDRFRARGPGIAAQMFRGVATR